MIDTGAAAPTTAEPVGRYGAVAIDEVERAIAAELDGASLVGEIDLDTWGPLAEEVLRSAVREHQFGKVERLWPGTYATYLVYEGIHKYEDAKFWDNVSIPALRDGKVAGPRFEASLIRLGLATFDDLEANEGIAKQSRGRYLRRIHLHGGLPRNAIGNVLTLLAATLRSGAATAPEVLDRWSSITLHPHLHSTAAERLLAYTGDFGVRLVDNLIRLLRDSARGRPLAAAGVPSYLVDGVVEFIEQGATASTSFEIVAGPRVVLDQTVAPGPVLIIPRGDGVSWSVDGAEAGVSSVQVERSFRLRPPGPLGWQVDSEGAERDVDRRFRPTIDQSAVFVFDERGRLHPRATTLGGIQADVLAPLGTRVSGVFERRAAGPDWPDHEVLTTDLRGQSALTIDAPLTDPASIAIDSTLSVTVDGDLVAGVTLPDGTPVFADRVALAFTRFVPDPAVVAVEVGSRVISLADLDEEAGEFDLTPFVGDHPDGTIVTVRREGADPVALSFARIAGLEIERPLLAPPDSTESVRLTVRRAGGTFGRTIEVAPRETAVAARVSAPGLTADLTVSIDRVFWALEGPTSPVPAPGNEVVSLRVDELRHHRLRLYAGSVPVEAVLVADGVDQVKRATRHRTHDGVSTVALRAFADTVQAAADASIGLGVRATRNSQPITIGVIEGRFEPSGLVVERIERDGRTILGARWYELAHWPQRELRVWDRHTSELVATAPIEDGVTRAALDITDLAPGRYLVEVGTTGGWSTPSMPTPGRGRVGLLVDSPLARRFREAILGGDRRAAFTDEELDSLTGEMADLLVRVDPVDGAATAREALIERVADDRGRALEIINDLADGCASLGNDERDAAIDRALLDVAPFLADIAARSPLDDDEAFRFRHLWAIAPLAAACLDAGDDAGTMSRWRTVTGHSPAASWSVSDKLDSLVGDVPSDLHERGPVLGLLNAGAWSRALRQLDRLQHQADAKQQMLDAQFLFRQIDRRGGPPGPTWLGVRNRSRQRTRALAAAGARDVEPAGDWLADIIGLACWHLDPASPLRADEVQRALLDTQALCPIAVRCALLLAAASLRVLEHAPN